MEPLTRPTTGDQFVKALTDSRVMEPAEARQALAHVPVRGDGRAIAQELVKQEKLTSYQAGRLLRGKSAGLVLGTYVILEELGQGGMGVVFKARHRRLNRLVAIKLLSPEVTGKEVALKRFKRETHAVAKLSHPNIVAALDAGEEQGAHFLVMEYVPGCDLARWVKEHGPLSVSRAVDCIRQAARGLACAHAAGIVHRDIKPSNLLIAKPQLADPGVVKVLDLGLARIDQRTGRGNETVVGDLTQTGSIMGTCDFMAPEQALNAKTADQRADIYSLGCTLYFLVTGKPMYHGDTAMEKVFAHREEPIPPLPGAARGLQAVFQRMVAKSPDQRYGSMTEAIAALESYTAKPAAGRPRRRRWWLAAGTAAAAGLLVALLIGLRAGDSSTPVAPMQSSKPVVESTRPVSPIELKKDGGWRIVQQPATTARAVPDNLTRVTTAPINDQTKYFRDDEKLLKELGAAERRVRELRATGQ
jgi:tRNA A-37 threonylcarbamoyl transferase component Bud32